mmetsp:Transcript_32409/g.91835  ORF Transcript_32409/g.91835 Transcript_32409/m.91835 type:complete len:350 (+) Transcript_32409:280-1329(+)
MAVRMAGEGSQPAATCGDGKRWDVQLIRWMPGNHGMREILNSLRHTIVMGLGMAQTSGQFRRGRELRGVHAVGRGDGVSQVGLRPHVPHGKGGGRADVDLRLRRRLPVVIAGLVPDTAHAEEGLRAGRHHGVPHGGEEHLVLGGHLHLAGRGGKREVGRAAAAAVSQRRGCDGGGTQLVQAGHSLALRGAGALDLGGAAADVHQHVLHVPDENLVVVRDDVALFRRDQTVLPEAQHNVVQDVLAGAGAGTRLPLVVLHDLLEGHALQAQDLAGAVERAEEQLVQVPAVEHVGAVHDGQLDNAVHLAQDVAVVKGGKVQRLAQLRQAHGRDDGGLLEKVPHEQDHRAVAP